MIARSVFIAFMMIGIAACTMPETYVIFDDTAGVYVKRIRPIVTQVTFENNPYTVPREPTPYDSPDDVEADPCEGLAFTEDEVKEYFRVATPIISYEYKDCMPTRCGIHGKFVLEDGREGIFGIDLGRQGWLETNDRWGVHYYCEKCKNKKFYEAEPVERACSNKTPDEWERLDKESQEQ
jgi:hypothetical protein